MSSATPTLGRALGRIERRLLLADELAPFAPPELADGLPLDWCGTRVERERVLAWWQQWRARCAEPGGGAGAQFYLHVPFCASRCAYCQFPATLVEPGAVEAYVGSVVDEAQAFSAALGPLSVGAAAIGGGTPSVLEVVLLERLLAALVGRVFVVARGGYFSAELNPESTSGAKLSCLANAGVNRVSLGLQSWHAPTLQAVGRARQTPEVVGQAVALVRRQAGGAFGLDLLASLPHETAESFCLGARRTLELEPDEVVLYRYQPVERGAKRLEPGPLDYARAGRLLGEEAGARGYRLELASGTATIVRAPGARAWPTRYRQHSLEPTALLGFGPHAESHLPALARYRTLDRSGYLAQQLGADHEAAAFVARHLAHAQPLDETRFQALFGQGLDERFGVELGALVSRGLLQREAGRWLTGSADRAAALRHCWLFVDRPTIEAVRRRSWGSGSTPEQAAAWLGGQGAALAGDALGLLPRERIGPCSPEIWRTDGGIECARVEAPLGIDAWLDHDGDAELGAGLAGLWRAGQGAALEPPEVAGALRVVARLLASGALGTPRMALTVASGRPWQLELAARVAASAPEAIAGLAEALGLDLAWLPTQASAALGELGLVRAGARHGLVLGWPMPVPPRLGWCRAFGGLPGAAARAWQRIELGAQPTRAVVLRELSADLRRALAVRVGVGPEAAVVALRLTTTPEASHASVVLAPSSGARV